jgi:integrase
LVSIGRRGQPALGPRALQLARLYLADRLTQRKTCTVRNDLATLVAFARWLVQQTSCPLPFEWELYDEFMARAFLRSCEKMADNGCHFLRLRLLYEWGVVRQYPDFDRAFFQKLKAIHIQSQVKEHHVRFRHATKGPFSEAEMQRLLAAVHARKSSDQDRALVMLHLELGANPHALVRLANRDFIRVETQHGTFYQLDVPRVKKHSALRETKRRPISSRLGELLAHLQMGEPEDGLLNWLSTDLPLQDIRARLRCFVAENDIHSPRTGELLHITSRRFRHTLATRLAAEGASRYHIAEVLDHSDLQHVEVYIETTPAIADRFAAATDQVMEPLVRRFLGTLVEATDGPQVPAQSPHLPLPMLKVGGVGTCGRNIEREGLCRLFPPLSCYLCPSFAAWRSGPHQELLASMDAFLDANLNRVDERILRQLDEVRSAIAEVIAQCSPTEIVEEVAP